MNLMAMLGIGSLIKNLASSGNALNGSSLSSVLSNLLGKKRNVISQRPTMNK